MLYRHLFDYTCETKYITRDGEGSVSVSKIYIGTSAWQCAVRAHR